MLIPYVNCNPTPLPLLGHELQQCLHSSKGPLFGTRASIGSFKGIHLGPIRQMISRLRRKIKLREALVVSEIIRNGLLSGADTFSIVS